MNKSHILFSDDSKTKCIRKWGQDGDGPADTEDVQFVLVSRSMLRVPRPCCLRWICAGVVAHTCQHRDQAGRHGYSPSRAVNIDLAGLARHIASHRPRCCLNCRCHHLGPMALLKEREDLNKSRVLIAPRDAAAGRLPLTFRDNVPAVLFGPQRHASGWIEPSICLNRMRAPRLTFAGFSHPLIRYFELSQGHFS